MPSAAISGVSSTPKPNVRPSRVSSASSPAALCPNRKFSPTTTSAACRCSTSTSCTNCSADSRENSGVNGITHSTSAPSASISSALRAGSVSTAGCEPGRTTSAGCGSKVTTTDCTPRSRARLTVCPMISWCPRCTPSKTPIVIAERPQPLGAASYPRQRCMPPQPSVARNAARPPASPSATFCRPVVLLMNAASPALRMLPHSTRTLGTTERFRPAMSARGLIPSVPM